MTRVGLFHNVEMKYTIRLEGYGLLEVFRRSPKIRETGENRGAGNPITVH